MPKKRICLYFLQPMVLTTTEHNPTTVEIKKNCLNERIFIMMIHFMFGPLLLCIVPSTIAIRLQANQAANDKTGTHLKLAMHTK